MVQYIAIKQDIKKATGLKLRFTDELTVSMTPYFLFVGTVQFILLQPILTLQHHLFCCDDVFSY